MFKKLLFASLLLYAGLLVSHAGQANAQVPRKAAAAVVAPRTFYTLGIVIAHKGSTGFNIKGNKKYISLSGLLKAINDTASGSYSPKSLFRDYSYGRVDWVFKTFPSTTPTDTIAYYADPNRGPYYEKYDAITNLIGYKTDDESSARKMALRNNAIAFANTLVPAGEKLDGDGDGKIDNVCFMLLDDTYRGIGAYASSRSGNIAGTNIGYYIVTMNYWPNNQPFGTLCHEIGHTMGLENMVPDTYDTDPIYRNDVRPSAKGLFIAHTRYVYNTYAQFVKPNEIKFITKPGTYAINNVYSATPDGCYYRINSPFSSTEFFMLTYQGASVYQKEQEGLQINRITPGVWGNAQWGNYRPVEDYFLRPFGNPSGSSLINRDVTEFSDPALILSDKTPAGFRIKNIRKEGTQLKFEFEYTDTKPFVDVIDTVDVVNSGVNVIEWPVTVNPANAGAWRVQGGGTGWLTYVADYEKQVLRITTTANTTTVQRNGTFKVYIGTTLVDWAYLVQRPNNNGDVIWAPKIINGVLNIDGNNPGMHNLRIIGDLDPKPFSYNQFQTTNGMTTKYLPTRELSIYAPANNTGANINAAASYKTKAGATINFTITQTPTTVPEKTYWIKPMPVANDGKWYLLESRKASKVFGNYLKPVKLGVDNVLGVDVFTASDSLYWAFETNAAGKVVIKNKALGYLNFDAVANNILKFQATKPILGVTMWQGRFSTGSWSPEYSVPSVSFYGDTTAVFRGLRHTDLANDFRIGYTNFTLLDEATRFQFTEKSVEAIYALSNGTASMVRIGNGIGETTELKKTEFFNAINLAYQDYMKISNPTEAQTDAAIRAIWEPSTTLLNSINKVQTSTAGAPVWYKIKTNRSQWDIPKMDYLYTNTNYKLLYTVNVNDADNFLFQFQDAGNGKVYIVSKKYPTYALRSGTKLYGEYIFTTTRDQYNNFELIDYPGGKGVKKLIIGTTLDASYPSYMLSKAKSTDIIRNDLWQDLSRGKDYGEHTNTFEIETVTPVVLATETIIDNHAIIRVIDGRILVDGTDKVEIYSIYGVKMPLKQQLPTGVYIVVVANRAQKVLVR